MFKSVVSSLVFAVSSAVVSTVSKSSVGRFVSRARGIAAQGAGAVVEGIAHEQRVLMGKVFGRQKLVSGRECAAICSGDVELRHVTAEMKELLVEWSLLDLQGIQDETKDVLFMWLAFLHRKAGLNLSVPEGTTSYFKYRSRLVRGKFILMVEGLFDANRAEVEGMYWKRYCGGGTNFDKPEKRAAFVAAARADLKGGGR